MNDATSSGFVTLDPQNPWLGLFSYTEETRAYFHGRDEETAELARRVQGKNLSVLFGQSGLGKTSLLRAGLVPRLRGEGFRPVYVRISYAPESPSPSEQIKQAIFRATADSGVWTRPGSAIAGESLWEFLHHRGDLLRDSDGQPLIPLLIFDQFEEIFTLGQADDAGRERARLFLADLADLVENRPPAALEQRMDDDDAVAEDYDFARADYRVLIALREDYLAHLESVKGAMPSITQNRMRLARMTGTQALSAVLKPGGRLVSQEVAESIVRFVAGGSELANAEVEPSLLSLVCRELNNARLAQGRAEISADLLAGSRDTILSEFYERALADQPEGVRRVVEDELLTESGYRESLAEERVLKVLVDAGAAPGALATLVNRRLLRIEDRLDVRRVELTHDVLCGVVLASRNVRQERERRDAAERQLAEQRQREATAHRALVRTRFIAGVCAVLMLFAIAAAAFGWIAMQRARSAETEAQKSRSDAENLVGFLIEDFYAELEPTGRLETLGKLSAKAVAYYDSLPPELMTRQTRINRAMALVREGTAQDASGKLDDAYRNFTRAQTVFEHLRAAGDHGEPVTYGLALSLYTQGNYAVVGGGNGRGSATQLAATADLLRPLVYAPGATRRSRQLYADDLNVLSHTQPPQQAVKTCDEARKVLADLGALDLSDLAAASSYADTADSEARHLLSLGRIPQAITLETQVADLAGRILARRPGDLHAMADRAWAAELLSSLSLWQHDPATAIAYANKSIDYAQDEVRFNPSDLGGWQRWAVGLVTRSTAQFQDGDIAAAIATLRSLATLEQDPRRPANLGPAIWYTWIALPILQAQAGDAAGARASLRHFQHDVDEAIAQSSANNPRRLLLSNAQQGILAEMELAEGMPDKALADATAHIRDIDAVVIPAGETGSRQMRINILDGTLPIPAEAALRLGRYQQAEALARRWLALPQSTTSESDPRIGTSNARTLLARALAMQGQGEEARKTLQPALAFYRHEQKAGETGTGFRHDYAYALYVSAIAAPTDASGRKQRASDLAQAAKLISGAPTQVQELADVRYLSGLIAQAR